MTRSENETALDRYSRRFGPLPVTTFGRNDADMRRLVRMLDAAFKRGSALSTDEVESFEVLAAAEMPADAVI